MALAVRQISASATLTAFMCENVISPFCRALEQFADEPAESATAPFSAALGRTPRLSGVGFVFTLFSQAFEDRHFIEREVSSWILLSAVGAIRKGCQARAL
jgi:hypothetical protein